MNPKILITGSAGFVFSNFLRRCIYTKQPYTFVSVDNISKTNVLNNVYSNKNHQFYIGDISNEHFINTLFEIERPDYVIHGAAELGMDDSIYSSPEKFINSNILGTQIIINACLKWKVKKLIYISTNEVYGQLKNDQDSPWIEDSIISPNNPYSATKAAGEMLVKAASDTFGLVYNITRSSSNYGPRQTPNKLIPKIIKCIENNEKIPIYGQGRQIRDWIYVDDNCFGILEVLKNGRDNEIYNISSSQEFSNIEIVQKVCNFMKKGHDLISFIPDKLNHDFRRSMNSNKLRKLGWDSHYSFNDGLEVCIPWYLNNKWWFK